MRGWLSVVDELETPVRNYAFLPYHVKFIAILENEKHSYSEDLHQGMFKKIQYFLHPEYDVITSSFSQILPTLKNHKDPLAIVVSNHRLSHLCGFDSHK